MTFCSFKNLFALQLLLLISLTMLVSVHQTLIPPQVTSSNTLIVLLHFLLTFILSDYPVCGTVCLFLTKTFPRRQLYLLSKITFGLISLSITILLIHALYFMYHVHVLTVFLLSLTDLILFDPDNFPGCLTVESVLQSHFLIFDSIVCTVKPEIITIFNYNLLYSLCLGGRSHEAYSSRGVSHSVILSVCRNDFSSLAEN